MLPAIVRGGESGWPVRLIVHANESTLIGETGFHSPPDETGAIEIGYSIVPEYRGRGLAFEAVRALVEHALGGPRVRRVIAECLHDNHPSLRILRKLGMRRIGRSGDALRFELHGSDLGSH